MTFRVKQLFLVVILTYPALCAGRPGPVPKGMVRIAGGAFQPLYAPAGQRTAQVAPFMIDTVPVSEAEFAAYLKHDARRKWDARKPVTNVSWLAASGYCRARGARLPTTIEWEYVARADEKAPDAAATASFKQRALELAITVKSSTPLIGDGLRNVWGVRDLHGGVAEWTVDFNPSAHAHNRGHHNVHIMTCASGTVATGDGSDYAAFLRDSFRRTLNIGSAANNLGFRCAV